MSLDKLNSQLGRFFEDAGVLLTGSEVPENSLWRKTAALRSTYPDDVRSRWQNNARLIAEVIGTTTNENISAGHGLKVFDNKNPDEATIDRLITRVAGKFGIPAALLKGIAKLESNWRQFDEKGQPVSGHNTNGSSDWGILQINDKAHPGAFPKVKVDIVANLEYGAKYLAGHYRKYGNWMDAVAAYNAGSPRRTSTGAYVNQRYVDVAFKHAKSFGLS